MKILLYLLFLLPSIYCLVPLEDFFPFGVTNNEQAIPPSDDGSSPPQTLTIPFPFFDKLYKTLWVNVNGAISFNSAIQTFTPTCIPLNYSMIGPFWADIDTTDQKHGDAVYYGESMRESDLLQAETEVINAFPNLYGIKFKSVFIATWFNVTFFNATKHPEEKRNTFQAAIATDGIHSFAIFYYNQITWTTGDLSHGVDGLGGTPAQAGFDAGDAKNRLMLDGSCKNDILTIQDRSNVNFPGKWIFRVDSSDIETAGCTPSFVPSNTLKISPSTVSTLGQVAVEVSGPCFKTTNTTVTCRIHDHEQFPYFEVKGKIIGSGGSVKVICGIPYLYSSGRMKLELVLVDDLAPISFLNTTYHGYLYVTKLNPESNNLGLQVNKDSNGTAVNTTFSWDPNSFINGTDYITLQMILFDLEKPSAENVIKLAEKIDNSGQWIWQHSNNNGSDESVAGLSQICSYNFGRQQIVFQAIEFGWDMMGNLDYQSHWIANSAIDANKFIGDFCALSIRAKACNDWLFNAEYINSSLSQPCPPTAEQAAADLRFIPQTPSATTFYHPGEDICYELIIPFGDEEGKVCCYKEGNIDCSFGSGGHTQKVHSVDPFERHAHDIIPWLMCCYDQDDALCGKYQSVRSCDPGNRYIPPGLAAGFGDPHLYTFDGLFYTFNGFGEFWILENSTYQPLAVQARMEPLSHATSKATIFSGFVFAAGESSSKIQIQKSLIRVVDIFVDDQLLDITSPNSLRQLSIDGWKIIISDDYRTIHLGTNLGFYFKITTFNGALGISVVASWKSDTGGLLGNFDGDKSNDLTSKNGTILNPNSSLQQIHYDFGLSWAVTPSTSLFTYFGGKTFADYNNPAYTPTFSFNTSAVSNFAGQESCKNDWACLFDFYYTGNLALANFTLISNQNYENAVTILNKQTQMCSELIAPENGYLNVSNFFKGSTASFGCFTNYTINSNISFICDDSYQWNPTNWSSIVCNYNFANNSSPSLVAFNFISFCLALIFSYFILL